MEEFQTVMLPFCQLEKILKLPQGVKVVSVKESHHGMFAEFRLYDPENTLTTVIDGEQVCRMYNIDEEGRITQEFVSSKGTVRGK